MKGKTCLQKGITLLLVTTIAIGFLNAQTPDANGIVYVNKNIAASGVGNSWVNAVKEFADALKAAKTNTAIKEIWVAKGTYYPKYSPANNNFGNNANKDNSFLMVKNVKLFGGFDPANSMTTMASRNPKNAVTILSGDIDQNNAITNNVFHVLIATGDVGTAELDGFTITGGNADNSVTGVFMVGDVNIPRYEGAGIYINGGSPVMSQLIVNENRANQSAGVNFVNSAASILNSKITNNTAVNYFGGGMSVVNSSVNITNILFNDNKATSASGRGGALYITNCSPVFTNVTISNNTAAAGGGIYNLYNGKPVFRNSILNSNAPNNLANNSGDSYATFSYSLIGGSGGSSAWVSSTGVDGGNNIDANPNFTNPAGNNFSLQDGSPAIGKGSNSLFPGLGTGTKDLEGQNRLVGANIDLGPYENQNALPVSFGNIQATIKDGQVMVQWQTLNETNNSHFLIQVSKDGNNWATLQTVQSKAEDGSSNTALDYSLSIPLTITNAVAMFLLAFGFSSIVSKHKKRRLLSCLLVCSFLFACHKNDLIKNIPTEKLLVRIVQVDKDGGMKASKIVVANYEN